MPKMSTPPFDVNDPHEMIDWLRREGYEVTVRNVRTEPGRIEIQLVGYQTRSPRVQTSSGGNSNYTVTGPSYLTDDRHQVGLGLGTRHPSSEGIRPAEPVEPEEETFGLAQPWEDVEEWFNC